MVEEATHQDTTTEGESSAGLFTVPVTALGDLEGNLKEVPLLVDHSLYKAVKKKKVKAKAVATPKNRYSAGPFNPHCLND